MSNRDVLLHKADLLLALDAEGKTVELHHALRMVRELRTALADYEADAIHTCGPDCKRPMCVLRAERDSLFDAMQHPSYEEENRLRVELAARNAEITKIRGELSDSRAGIAHEFLRANELLAELAALRAQEPVGAVVHSDSREGTITCIDWKRSVLDLPNNTRLYAAPAPAAVPDGHAHKMLKALASEMIRDWDADNDARLGKLLRALAYPEFAKQYRPDFAELHAMLAAAPSATQEGKP